MTLRSILVGIALIAVPLIFSSSKVAATLRVAVLPFEVYSDESTEYLTDTIAKELSAQMAIDKKITTVDQADIKRVLESEPPLNFNEVALKRISERLTAHFLVLGSLTRISENLSMDVYVFNPQGPTPFSKDFTEGKELNSLVRQMARKVSAKVLLIARNYPELQEPEAVEKAELKATVEEAAPSDTQPSPSASVQKEEEKEETKAVLTEGQVREEPLEPEAKETVVSMLATPDLEKAVEEPKDISSSSPFAADRPIKITSDTLEADNKRNMVTFKGNVIARQESMVIFSDIMKVNYERKGGIKTVEASGAVKMTQEDRIATGQKIVFYNPEQKIVLTGNPKIWQDDNLISCDKVTVLLKEDKIFFEGEVDSTIYPKSAKENTKGAVQQIEEVSLPAQPKAEGETSKESKKTSLKDKEPSGSIEGAEKEEVQRKAVVTETDLRKEGVEESKELPLKEREHLKTIKSAEKDEVQKFIMDWKNYWESKDLENYMRCYSRDFTSKGMDWEQWKSYNRQRNEKYHQISLAFNEIQIALEDNRALVSFEQYYQSDDSADHGMKSLILKRENGSWKILDEQWDPL